MSFPVPISDTGAEDGIINYGEKLNTYLENLDQFEDLAGLDAKPIPETDGYKYIIKLIKKINSNLTEWANRPPPRGIRVVDFKDSDIKELEEKLRLMDGVPMFPDELVINPLKGILRIIKESKVKQEKKKARGEGRNLLAGKAAGLLESNSNKLNKLNKGIESSALKKLLGRNFFTQSVGSFLTNEPRIRQESEGTIGPALENLQRRARGEAVEPLRTRGTGTRGRPHTKHKGGSMTRKRYHATMGGVLEWAKAELEHVGRIVSIEDPDIQYSYALSTVNGMMHLRDALYEMVNDKKYASRKEDLLRTHDAVVRTIKHLINDFKINLQTIKNFNTRHVLSDPSSYLGSQKRLTRKAKKRPSRK